MTQSRPIDFLGKRRIAFGLSGVLLLTAILALAVRGLNFGIDFTGGTLVEVGYPEPVALESIRSTLEAAGYEGATVQHFGSSEEVLIRLRPQATGEIEGNARDARARLSEAVLRALSEAAATDVELRRVEFVGPKVGEELREDGGLAMLIALIGILIYVGLRFEYRFSVGAVAALIHDVLITLGVFAVLQIEFDLTVLAALLAVIGYSLNDTIVVFDRIRENFRKLRKSGPLEVMNRSVNQTISRTLITSLTTLLVLLALYFLGGEVMNAFAIALITGVIIGTYSSIYVASAAAFALGVSRTDLIPVEVEEKKDDRP
jgi:preprotein translocase subunit SecF